MRDLLLKCKKLLSQSSHLLVYSHCHAASLPCSALHALNEEEIPGMKKPMEKLLTGNRLK